MNILKGKKTYLLAMVLSVLTMLKASGELKVTPEQWELILSLIGAGGLASVRLAIQALKDRS